MATDSILILPGLDGTDQMLGKFRGLCAGTCQAEVLTLPSDASLDYPGLAEHFAPIIQQHAGCHVIAESFSGPIGILLARKFPECVSRLSLVASFATSPVPRFAAFLPWSLLFRLPLPSMIAKQFFVGKTTTLIPALKSAIKQNSVAVLQQRFKLVRTVNVLAELAEISCQLSYFRASDDRLVPRRCLDQILQARPDTTVHEIEGPHLILETRPDACWQQIAG